MIQILEQLDERLSHEDMWCQKAYAVDNVGEFTTPTNPVACRWCVMGHLRFLTQDTEMSSKIFHELLNDGKYTITWINDSYGREAVRAVVQKTISRLKAQGV